MYLLLHLVIISGSLNSMDETTIINVKVPKQVARRMKEYAESHRINLRFIWEDAARLFIKSKGWAMGDVEKKRANGKAKA